MSKINIDICVIGCENTGKSTIVNILSDIHEISEFFNITKHQNLEASLCDVSGVNIYNNDEFQSWIKDNIYQFDIILFVSDTKMNTSEYEISMIKFIIEITKKINCPIIFLLNKCDEISFDYNEKDMILGDINCSEKFMKMNIELKKIINENNLLRSKVHYPFIPLTSKWNISNKESNQKIIIESGYKIFFEEFDKIIIDNISFSENYFINYLLSVENNNSVNRIEKIFDILSNCKNIGAEINIENIKKIEELFIHDIIDKLKNHIIIKDEHINCEEHNTISYLYQVFSSYSNKILILIYHIIKSKHDSDFSYKLCKLIIDNVKNELVLSNNPNEDIKICIKILELIRHFYMEKIDDFLLYLLSYFENKSNFKLYKNDDFFNLCEKIIIEYSYSDHCLYSCAANLLLKRIVYVKKFDPLGTNFFFYLLELKILLKKISNSHISFSIINEAIKKNISTYLKKKGCIEFNKYSSILKNINKFDESSKITLVFENKFIKIFEDHFKIFIRNKDLSRQNNDI